MAIYLSLYLYLYLLRDGESVYTFNTKAFHVVMKEFSSISANYKVKFAPNSS
jgi:hypothetical protein